MSDELIGFTEKEISDLRGTEIVYIFNEGTHPLLDGKSTDAYVAQADRRKGITIMGSLPDCINTEDFSKSINDSDDIILQCCILGCGVNSDSSISLLNKYVTAIRSGVFSVPAEIASLSRITDICAF